jgi:hypothetical protein
MGLFKYEDHKVVVDLELKLIPEFKKLIANDKDRFKKNVIKDFAYIYFMYDYKSPYVIYSEDDRHDKLVKELELGDFKVTRLLQDAIDKYLELQETPTLKSLTATRDGLLTASKVISKLQKVINNKLEAIDDENNDMEEILSNVEKLLKISSELPKAVNTVQQLEKRVKEEQVGESKIRGGGKVNLFEDPN